MSALQSQYAVAQQKRDGHYRKLVAEQARSKQLSQELDSLEELYATAQHKRDGHFLHLEAERARSKALLEVAKNLHAENQIFKSSIAFKLGSALLAMRRPTGIFRFPLVAVSSLREKWARPDGKIQTAPFVPPRIAPVMLPAKKSPARRGGRTSTAFGAA
ncbi:hypothetical protein [Lysobacter olei]